MAEPSGTTKGTEGMGVNDQPRPGERHRNAAVGDRPADDDLLGFDEYVETVAEFLSHPNTKPPLTVSVEGEWGTGKSTFMRLLEKELGKRRGYRTVSFNPWRHETEDAMWAAFMQAFIRQVSHDQPPLDRLSGHLRLTWARLTPGTETGLTARVGALLLAIVAFPVALWVFGSEGFASVTGIEQNVAPGVSTGLGTAWVLFGLWLLRADVVGRTERELEKFLADPGYENRVSFVERVHADLGAVLDAYVGPKDDRRSRVFVFVDDLDRCEVAKSAELMRAINLLFGEDPRLVFVLGLDRAKVAAGIAVRNKESLTYLAPGDVSQYGLTFGYEFLEKFIHVPFQIPRPSGERIVAFTNSLLADEVEETSEDTDGPGDATVSWWTHGTVTVVVLWVARAMEFNPRRLKQFLNVFRLQAKLVSNSPQITVTSEEASGDGTITPQQLGKFLAVTLQWPRLLPELAANPRLLAERHEVALRWELRRWLETSTDTDPVGEAGDPDGGDGNEGRDDSDRIADDADQLERSAVAPDPTGSFSMLTDRMRGRLDELLLAGLYGELPPGFETHEELIGAVGADAASAPPSPPDLSALEGRSVEEIPAGELETLTGARPALSLLDVDVETLLRITGVGEVDTAKTVEGDGVASAPFEGPITESPFTGT